VVPFRDTQSNIVKVGEHTFGDLACGADRPVKDRQSSSSSAGGPVRPLVYAGMQMPSMTTALEMEQFLTAFE
jgi:hypothetical protein